MSTKTTPEPRPSRGQWLNRIKSLLLTMEVSLEMGEDRAGFILSADHLLETYNTAVAPVVTVTENGVTFEVGGYGITPEEIGYTQSQAIELWSTYRAAFPLAQPGPKGKLDPMRYGKATGGRWTL